MFKSEPFYQRQKRLARGDEPIVWQRDTLPEAFRNQVVHLLRRALGNAIVMPTSNGMRTENNPAWRRLHDDTAESVGKMKLAPTAQNSREACETYVQNSPDVNGVLHLIEAACRTLTLVVPKVGQGEIARLGIKEDPEVAVRAINERLREHAIGYQFEDGQLIAVDSTYVHAEMVAPAIAPLHQAGFTGPNDEFLGAHEHYRHGRHEEALVEALKAFESTMIAICDTRKWQYPKGPTAKQLIGVILDNGLVPSYQNNQFNSLATLLEGLPTVRNKQAGHGQGSNPRSVPNYLAAYGLHLAAANIVLLVEAHKALP